MQKLTPNIWFNNDAEQAAQFYASVFRSARHRRRSRCRQDGSVLMEFGKYPFSEHYGWTADKYDVSWQAYACR
jgi:predicted 3-demethylubiquinone-9 3-methyltransferase (glyoxalase superfamily)